MTDAEIQKKISLLSEEQKEALLEFLDTLITSQNKRTKSERLKAYGALKGKIKMHEGFDDPIEDFFNPIDPE